jgi:ParB-like chromosome segregation protein Spo0J
MARRKGALSTVAAFMSDEAQTRLQQQKDQITYIEINQLRPDPDQPRRLIPPDLAQAVATGKLTPLAAITAWQERIQTVEAGNAVAEDIRLNNWQELIRLADSIAQHGLINPVTVQPWPEEDSAQRIAYRIVTGERRYWAHVLLAAQDRSIQVADGKPQDPNQIKALISPEGISIRAHQLIENVQREDINAIEKAEGLWALRYELSGVTHGTPPQRNTQKSKPNLVPWSQVEESVGISKRHRIRLTSVLTLSEEAQRIVAENSLTERAVRPIVAKLKQWPDLQAEAIRHLAAWQQESESEQGLDRSVATLVDEMIERFQEGVEDALSTPKQPPSMPEPLSKDAKAAQKFHRRLQATRRYLDRTKADELVKFSHTLPGRGRQEVIQELERLQTRIDKMLEAFKAAD